MQAERQIIEMIVCHCNQLVDEPSLGWHPHCPISIITVSLVVRTEHLVTAEITDYVITPGLVPCSTLVTSDPAWRDAMMPAQAWAAATNWLLSFNENTGHVPSAGRGRPLWRNWIMALKSLFYMIEEPIKGLTLGFQGLGNQFQQHISFRNII